MVRTFGQPKRGLTWARVVTTALLLGPSFFSGCDVAPPGEWQVHPDIAVLTKRQEDCVESSRATFAVRSTRTIDRGLAVASIVPIGTDTSVIATTEGHLYVLATDSLIKWVSDPVAIVRPSQSAMAVAITRQGEIVELGPSADNVIGRSRNGRRLPAAVAVEGVAVTTDAVWITATDGDRRVLYRERKDANGTSHFDAVRWFDAPVWIGSVSDAAVAVGNIEPPFATWLVASDGSTVGWFGVPDARQANPLREGRWVSLGVWPLDCGTVVQVLADLTSRLRRMAFHRLEPDGSITTRLGTVIDQPFGVVASYPEDRTFIALTDRGESWELQSIDWTWSASNEQRRKQ